MRHFGRRLALLVAGIVVGAVGLVWFGFSAAYLSFNDAVLGNFISAKVDAVNRGRFTLRRVRYPYWGGLASLLFDLPAHAVGEDFTLVDPDGNRVIRVPVAYADVKLRTLVLSLVRTALTGGRHLYLTLDFPKAFVPTGWAVVAPTRSTWGNEKEEMNIVAAMASRKKIESTGGALVIRVGELELGDVGFALAAADRDGSAAWSAKIEHGRAKGGLYFSSEQRLITPDGPHFFFRLTDVTAPKANLQLGEYPFPLTEVEASEFGVHDEVRQTLHFAATARSLGAKVVAKGRLTEVYADDPGVVLDLDVTHGRGPLAFLPAPLSTWLSGDPRGHMHFEGPFRRVVIDGEVQEIEGNLEGFRLQNGSARLHFVDGILKLEPAAGQLGGGRAVAELALTLSPKGRWWGKVQLTEVDPARLPPLPPALAAELAGRLDGRVTIAGDLDQHQERIELTRLDAVLERQRGGGRLPRRIALTGGLQYTPMRITLRKLAARGEGVVLTTDGALDPRSGALDADLQLDGRDVDALWARLGLPGLTVGVLSARGHVRGTYLRPTLALHATASDLAHRRLPGRLVDALEAELRFDRGQLFVDQLSGKALGATLAGAGDAALFAGSLDRPLEEPHLRAKLTARGLSIGAASGLADLGGRADVEVALSGAVAHPDGFATALIPSLSYRGDAYADGRLKVVLSRKGAELQELSIRRVQGGRLGARGRLGWGGELALQLAPRDLPVTALFGASAVPVPLAGKLSGDVDFGGTLVKPTVAGLLSLVGFKVREALLGKGELKLEPVARGVHLSGTFFGNVAVDGTLTVLPKLTLVATVRFRDLALERFFPELQKLAEVRGLASGTVALEFDAERATTNATITLDKLRLTLRSTDEKGRAHELLVKNANPILAVYAGQALELRSVNLQSQMGEFAVRGSVGKLNQLWMRGHINLELLEYFFRGLFEHTHGPAELELTIAGDLARPQLRGHVTVGAPSQPVELVPRGLEGKLRLTVSSGRVDVTPQSIRLTAVELSSERGKSVRASGELQLDHWVPGTVSGSLDGELSLRLLQWAFRDQLADASGFLAVNLQAGGSWQRPRWHGLARLEDVYFLVRRIGHDLRFTDGTIGFDNFDVVVGCPKGLKVAGCRPITGLIDDDAKILGLDGRIAFGDGFALKKVDLRFVGREIRYAQRGWSVTLSPALELTGSASGLKLAGSINLVDGRYSQNFELVDMIFRPKTVEVSEPFWQGRPLLESMRLDLHAQSSGTLLVKNNLAELPLTAVLDVTGTLSEPRLDGTITVEEGGRLTPYFSRYPFSTDHGQVTFNQERRFPNETPIIDLRASTVYTDKNDQQHTLNMRLFGPLAGLQFELGSQEGWDRATVLAILVGGQSPEDFRRLAQGSQVTSTQVSGSATENIARSITGATLGQFISNPLRQQIGLDVVNVEFGGSSFQLNACKRLGRWAKTCGQGEVGFGAGASRFGGSVELRLSDRPLDLSGVTRVEYLTRGIETLQESVSSWRGELKLRLPLGF